MSSLPLFEVLSAKLELWLPSVSSQRVYLWLGHMPVACKVVYIVHAHKNQLQLVEDHSLHCYLKVRWDYSVSELRERVLVRGQAQTFVG